MDSAQCHNNAKSLVCTSVESSRNTRSRKNAQPAKPLDTPTKRKQKKPMDDKTRNPRKLFIGGIGQKTVAATLRNHFTKFGQVVECVLVTQRKSGRSRGFGFVTFLSDETAERVLEDKHKIDEVLVECRHALPKDEAQSTALHDTLYMPNKLFVGGIPDVVNETDFREYFKEFGEVLDASLAYDKMTHRPRGFGFILFKAAEAVAKAVGRHQMAGKTVEAKPSIPRDECQTRKPAFGANTRKIKIHDPTQPTVVSHQQESGEIERLLSEDISVTLAKPKETDDDTYSDLLQVPSNNSQNIEEKNSSVAFSNQKYFSQFSSFSPTTYASPRIEYASPRIDAKPLWQNLGTPTATPIQLLLSPIHSSFVPLPSNISFPISSFLDPSQSPPASFSLPQSYESSPLQTPIVRPDASPEISSYFASHTDLLHFPSSPQCFCSETGCLLQSPTPMAAYVLPGTFDSSCLWTPTTTLLTPPPTPPLFAFSHFHKNDEEQNVDSRL